jgi:hypothetical protein
MAYRPGFIYDLAIGTANLTASRVTPIGVCAVRVAAITQPAYITVAQGGLAATTSNGVLINAGAVGEIIGVTAGDVISCISASGTAGGVVNITEVSSV